MVPLEDPEHRAKVLKKLSKRTYYLYKAKPRAPEHQLITGFECMEYTVFEVMDDGTVKLAYFTTPFYSVYGAKAMAKRRPNGTFWYLSDAFADSLDVGLIIAMQKLGADGFTDGLQRFDVNDLYPIL